MIVTLFSRARFLRRVVFFFFQAEDGIRDPLVTGVQTCASSDLVLRELREFDGSRGAGHPGCAPDWDTSGWYVSGIPGLLPLRVRPLPNGNGSPSASRRSEERRVGNGCG